MEKLYSFILFLFFLFCFPDIIHSQQSIDDDQKGKYYCVYYDEGRYWGRFLNVSVFLNGLCIKFWRFYCSVYTIDCFIGFSGLKYYVFNFFTHFPL